MVQGRLQSTFGNVRFPKSDHGPHINQAAIIALLRVINRYVGNLPPIPGVFPDYPAPVVRNVGADRELTMMRWGMPPPPRTGGPAGHQRPEHIVTALAGLAEAGEPLPGPVQ
jgi:putative SOS response-associated peptidase YedK